MNTNAIRQLNDIVLDTGADGKLKAFVAKGYPKQQVLYQISGVPVEEVITFPFHDFVLLQTAAGIFPRDLNNRPLADEAPWTDFFFEPHTCSFYRKDERENWYDLEGFRIEVPVFLKGDVLISLNGKISRKSWAHRDQEVLISTNARLIQVGKIVYDVALAPVLYFGEKITGLGPKHISFGGNDQWQEVCRGKVERAFINEFTGQPLLLNDEEIVEHRQHLVRGARHFEVFASANRQYVLEGSSEGEIRYEGRLLNIFLSTLLPLPGKEIVLADDGKERFYFNLNTRAPFKLALTQDELIKTVSQQPVQVPGLKLYDITTAHQAFVYNMEKDEPFYLAGEEKPPTSIAEVPGFEAYFFMAELDGLKKLCTKHDLSVVKLGEQEVEIGAILSPKPTKLINARGIRGEKRVLDFRRGVEYLALARVDGQQVESVEGKPHRVGEMIFQSIMLASLGGAVPRLIDLERPSLTTFTLPEDLTVYPEQAESSCFAGNPITSIDFTSPLAVLGEQFYRAKFLTYEGEEVDVLLRAGNARPLHLDGAGHRNELIVSIKPETANSPYRLGKHLLVSAETLNEELKSGELLFSINESRSWLPFFDDFLPVFRRAIPLNGSEYWPCLLFESLEYEGFGEYIAVEKEEPYRVLATRKKGKVIPKVVTAKSRALLDPSEVSFLVDLFVDRGMLVEV